MTSHYIPFDWDSVQENNGPDSQYLKALTNYRRLASILSVILTAVTVSLIVVLSEGKSIDGNVSSGRPQPTERTSTTISPITTTTATITTEPPCMTDECVSASGIFNYMDLTVDACNDFYKFTCGKWEDDHPLPAGRNDGWSPFVKLTYEGRKYMTQAIEKMKINETTEPRAYGKLNDFYNGCLDIGKRNSNGYSKLRSKLAQIGGWPTIDPNWTSDKFDLEEAIIASIKMKHFPLLKIQAIKDWMNNSQTIISIGPNTNPEETFTQMSSIIEDKLPRPKFEYFNAKDNKTLELYKGLVKELTKDHNITINTDLVTEDSEDLIGLYSNLQRNITEIDSIDYYFENYEGLKIQVQKLDKNCSGIDLQKIITSLFASAKNDTLVFVQDIQYLSKLCQYIATAEKRLIANYIGSSFVMKYGQFTTSAMVALLDTKLDNSEVVHNICYRIVETYLPNLLGRLYVDKNFNDKGREDMQKIVELLKNSFKNSVERVDWMDADTKQEALKKVQHLEENIACPNWTLDNAKLDDYYSWIFIDRDDFFTSVMNVVELTQDWNLLKLIFDHSDGETPGPKAIDSWPQHDATFVNAFYYFQTNGIYFPAAIAQDPFYVYKRPMAMNLGSIGMIIGHEMTHSLDTQGSLYDHLGNLKTWWKESTRETFLSKSQCFADQYQDIKFPEYKMNVDGNRTLAENIADNGGLRQAYEALQMYKLNRKEPFQRLPGKMSQFTEDQLFFISFANVWCSNLYPNYVKSTLQTSSHSPESARVFGTLSNFDKFSDAFNCKSGTKMNPKKKCVLW